MSSIAFVTHAALPGLSGDDRLAAGALEDRGARVTPAVWTDGGVRWRDFHAVVLRSTWDYHRRPVEFRAWLDARERDGTPLWNPARLARWNMDKRYLRDLQTRGVRIAPTRWLPRGAAPELRSIMADEGWAEVVLKPAISATAFETMRADAATVDAGQAHLDRVLRDRDVLVQQFLPEIHTMGEWSVVMLGGEFSHAALKRPRADDYRVQPEFGGSESAATPPAHVVDAACAAVRAAVAVTGMSWLYARVDGVETADGFVLLELEMLEPMLFLAQHPAAPARFADAVLAAV